MTRDTIIILGENMQSLNFDLNVFQHYFNIC